jgi:hypothetical protein
MKRTRLFRLINTQNGALRALPLPAYRSFTAPPDEINDM